MYLVGVFILIFFTRFDLSNRLVAHSLIVTHFADLPLIFEEIPLTCWFEWFCHTFSLLQIPTPPPSLPPPPPPPHPTPPPPPPPHPPPARACIYSIKEYYSLIQYNTCMTYVHACLWTSSIVQRAQVLLLLVLTFSFQINKNGRELSTSSWRAHRSIGKKQIQ